MTRPRTAKLLPLPLWIHEVSSRFAPPTHLAPITDVFAQIAAGAEIRTCLSAPPRHAKTTTLEHGVAWLLRQNPARRIIWASYGQRFAERSSRRVRELSARVGVPLAADAKARANWRTGVEDGGFWCTSVGGSITGEGADLLVVDDPHKGRAEAESALDRDRVAEWFDDDALTRLEPGASAIVSGARWHQDDLIGRLTDIDGWEYRLLPAIADGRALWPKRYTLAALEAIREQLGPYGFDSLFMGRPLPKGAQVFSGGVQFYEPNELPLDLKIGKGVDFAYTAKTRADHSAAIVIGSAGGKFYVLDVLRAQATVDQFLPRLRGQTSEWPGRYAFYASSTEQGIAQFSHLLGPEDVKIDARLARVDKFSRAQPVAAQWNAGRILLPRGAPWVDDFVAEICGFTGVRDRRDDQVDALAAAFDSIGPWRSQGRAGRARRSRSQMSGWCADDGGFFEPYSPVGGAGREVPLDPSLVGILSSHRMVRGGR